MRTGSFPLSRGWRRPTRRPTPNKSLPVSRRFQQQLQRTIAAAGAAGDEDPHPRVSLANVTFAWKDEMTASLRKDTTTAPWRTQRRATGAAPEEQVVLHITADQV